MGVFIDTGFYFALISNRDLKHPRSIELLQEMTEGNLGKIVTTDYIFDETMTLLNFRTQGKRIDLLLKMEQLFIGTDPLAEMHAINTEWFEEIGKMQREVIQEGNPFSFTDASNIICCQKRGIRNIISFDGQFKGILEVLE